MKRINRHKQVLASLNRYMKSNCHFTDDEQTFLLITDGVDCTRDASAFFYAGFIRGLRAASNNKFEPTRE